MSDSYDYQQGLQHAPEFLVPDESRNPTHFITTKSLEGINMIDAPV